jgi:hypothetical protein
MRPHLRRLRRRRSPRAAAPTGHRPCWKGGRHAHPAAPPWHVLQHSTPLNAPMFCIGDDWHWAFMYRGCGTEVHSGQVLPWLAYPVLLVRRPRRHPTPARPQNVWHVRFAAQRVCEASIPGPSTCHFFVANVTSLPASWPLLCDLQWDICLLQEVRVASDAPILREIRAAGVACLVSAPVPTGKGTLALWSFLRCRAGLPRGFHVWGLQWA